MQPVLFEVFGEMWKVQARLGQGGSASVYRVSSARSSSAAVKEFLLDAQGGDYGYLKERAVLEDIQGHKNIGKATGAPDTQADQMRECVQAGVYRGVGSDEIRSDQMR